MEKLSLLTPYGNLPSKQANQFNMLVFFFHPLNPVIEYSDVSIAVLPFRVRTGCLAACLYHIWREYFTPITTVLYVECGASRKTNGASSMRALCSNKWRLMHSDIRLACFAQTGNFRYWNPFQAEHM